MGVRVPSPAPPGGGLEPIRALGLFLCPGFAPASKNSDFIPLVHQAGPEANSRSGPFPLFRFCARAAKWRFHRIGERRSRLCIACSGFFQKSERTQHAAAPPFQPRPACAGLAADDETDSDVDCVNAQKNGVVDVGRNDNEKIFVDFGCCNFSAFVYRLRSV